MMPFFRTKFICITAVWALLNSCAPFEPNYAPVSTNNPNPPPTYPIPPANPTPPANTTKNEPQYYQVKKGDTLYAISLIYDLDYKELAQWNRIAPSYKIEVGQKLKVSAPNPENQAHTEEKTPANIVEAKPKFVAAAPMNAPIPTKKITVPPNNNKQAPAYKAPEILPPATNDNTEKHGSSPQKKSIISIDNGTMLKLNFQWPVKGKILKPFAHADNKGIDIAGEKEQEVKAAEAGKVVYSGQGPIGYGNLLIIKHNDLYLSAYANNSRLLVAEGNTVKKGEVVAKIGQAGSNKASLHFEIRKNGKPVNPMSFLPKK